MKKTLISASVPQYKANLHCHSTLSDGKFTPEELKSHYMAHGYAVIAFTDHERLYGHNDLTDGEFLALNGYEIGFGQAGVSGNVAKVCHICVICPTKDCLTPVEPVPFTDPYSAERINETIRRAKEAGYFVTYNHPVWSMESYPEYSRYHGMDALEIYNYSSDCGGWCDYVPQVYDDLLRLGNRIGCTATDDNHDLLPEEHPLFDSYGGFTYIMAPTLTYADVFRALKSGDYYASMGPRFLEVIAEDGQLRVKTSPVFRMQLSTKYRRAEAAGAPFGETITEAVFSVRPDDGYVRLDIVDEHGRHADTRAFDVAELL